MQDAVGKFRCQLNGILLVVKEFHTAFLCMIQGGFKQLFLGIICHFNLQQIRIRPELCNKMIFPSEAPSILCDGDRTGLFGSD